MKEKFLHVPLALALIVFGFGMRLLPHVPNVAPVGAIALFAGMYLPRRLAFALPLCAMLISDMVIGFYELPIMLCVYAGFFLMTGIGLFLKTRKSLPFLIVGTLAGSLVFYVVTNAAVWAFSSMYPHTLGGLMASYIAAIPFFRNSVIGDLFYTGLLVGSFELLAFALKHSQPQFLQKRSE